MTSTRKIDRKAALIVLTGLLLVGGLLPGTGWAMSTGEAVSAITGELMTEQMQAGTGAGSWPGEADFTGSIVAGMMAAYELTSESTCIVSAELGCSYILATAQGNFFGDEAYALVCLSQAAADPCDNAWRTAVKNFYGSVKTDYPDGTKGYITAFAGTDPSTAVFYIANHVVAAYSVNAADKELWRQGLTEYLCSVDDSCRFPVMALGVATWALAQTGPLDETVIDPTGLGAAYWNGRMLKDLPGLLLSHQVPAGQPDAGSFYWQFEHVIGDLCGYTEDAIFATLGLAAVAQTSVDPELDSAIRAAREALLGGVGPDGKVWEHLSRAGNVHCLYGGEMMQVLKALEQLPIRGDVNGDGVVDLADLEISINQWGSSDCSTPSWCQGADINRDGKVDETDIEILLSAWQK